MADFSTLTSDLIDLILSLLPIPSLLRSSAVCRLWHSIIRSPSFLRSCPTRPPWFFLYHTNSKDNQFFAFDPLSDLWFRLPPLPVSPASSFLGSDGFFFTTAPHFSFSPIFNPSWTITSPLRFARMDPLLGIFRSGSKSNLQFIVVGGVRLLSGRLDMENHLSVEIYDPDADFWELCSRLPPDFRSGVTSRSLSSAFFEGEFYVLGSYSFLVSCFDLHDHVWSEVQTLQPPGIIFSFLISCTDRLVLAGLCNSPAGPSFVLWKIDVETMEFLEISVMPSDLLEILLDGEEGYRFTRLKCVGQENLIYVFSKEYEMKYSGCVCEISRENGKCRWKRVPPLPSPMNKLNKVVSFCSNVSLHNILGRKDEEDQHYSSFCHV